MQAGPWLCEHVPWPTRRLGTARACSAHLVVAHDTLTSSNTLRARSKPSMRNGHAATGSAASSEYSRATYLDPVHAARSEQCVSKARRERPLVSARRRASKRTARRSRTSEQHERSERLRDGARRCGGGGGEEEELAACAARTRPGTSRRA